MNEKKNLKKAVFEDANCIANLATLTFRETYAAFNTPENLEQYIGDHYTEDLIGREIEDSSNHFFLVYQDNEAAGFALVSDKRTMPEFNSERGIELCKIYVLKKFQRMQLGLQLLNHCTAFAKQNKFKMIWLGVWNQNIKAIEFYQSQKFEIVGTTTFNVGEDVQEDYLMKKSLS